jgi:peptidoglycan/LPS O-acetylase OafA/YrhL
MSNTPIPRTSTRFAELDGLRALAVVAVILFHCEITGVMDAGFFGVDVFFTISGFIITSILLKEYRSDGALGFSNFYFRRLKRLLPPMLGLIAIAFVGTAAISPEALRKFVADAPAALLYGSNWWQIADRQDYFDTTPHVLRHLWSLAVEEQFYLVWPPVAYLALRRGGVKAAGLLAVAIALASTAWMWHLYELNVDATDQNRVYLGADTHAMGLLAGAALACCWNPWAPVARAGAARLLWRALALAALGLLGWMAATMNTASPWLYRGAFLLVPALSSIVIYATMGDAPFFVSRLLASPVMQWFGTRSYSLYLVHWPVFVWMRLLGHTDFADWGVLVPALAVVGAVSELMYRYVELPSKHYDLEKPGTAPKVAVIGGYVIIALAFSTAIRLVGVAPPPDMAHAAPAIVDPIPAQAVPAALTPAPAPELPAPADATADPADANVRIAGGDDLYALGDSVLLGASDHLRKVIPGIRIDAAVGRQASHGVKIVQDWHAALAPTSTVLVHLGTNGYINEGQFRELLQALAGCKSVIVMNVHADRRWTAPNNEIIARMIQAFPNTHLVDWSLVSAGHPDFFVKDGIHLTRRGILAYASQIRMATGGEPLPDPAPSAPIRTAAHKVAPGATIRGAKTAAGAAAPAPAPASASASAASAPALAAPERESGAAGHDRNPAPASEAQAE